MAFIPIPNTVLLTAEFQDEQGIEAVNRFYAATSGVPTETDLEDIADAYMSAFLSDIKDTMMSTWTLTACVTRAMNEEFGIFFNRTADIPANAAVGSGAQPNQVSATITWLTGQVGRSFRGRTYVVGLPLTFVDSGQKRLTTTGRNNLQDAYDVLRSNLETAGHAMQVVSLFSGGLPRTEGLTTPVLATRANFPLATQRRRLR